jgi:hypothetical protein
MKRITRCLPILALLGTHVATAQTHSFSIPSQIVAFEDWGFTDVADLRFGRVAITSSSTHPRLVVRWLQDSLPRVAPLQVRSVVHPTSGNSLVVADFGRSNRTNLGGYFNAFARRPREASATIVHESDGRRVLELSCSNQESGFCGLSIQLYDMEVPYGQRRYLDARSFSTLSFWVRGHHGHERVLLKVADAEWESKEDALPVGELADFVPTGRVDTTWQQVVIPLRLFPAHIRRRSLAMLVLEIVSIGATTVDLGPFALSLRADSLPPLPDPVQRSDPPQPPHKATWIWDVSDLMDDPTSRADMLDFLEREGFDRVFLQLPNGNENRGAPGELAIDAPRMRPLLAAFHSRGIRVYALDGAAEYALPQFHEGVLKTVENVIRYNAESSDNERFYGIRHDIEPYVLPGFHGVRHEMLLRGLLDLTEAVADHARTGGLVYGIDMPFWYDAPDEYTHDQVMLDFKGVRKPVSKHLMDLVDDIAVMDYRTTAYGLDGTLRHVSSEINYATAHGKSVFVGLETGKLNDETLLEFRGAPSTGLPDIMPTGAIIIVTPVGDSVRVFCVHGSSVPGGMADSTLAAWFESQNIELGALRWWPVSRRIDVPAARITFASHGVVALDRVMEETAAELARYPSFAGFAIHFAPSYMALVRNRSH